MRKIGQGGILWGILICIPFFLAGCAKEEPRKVAKVTEEEFGAREPSLDELEARSEEKAPLKNRMVIATFTEAYRMNELGGEFGCWNKDPNDATQTCRQSFDATTKIGDAGYSLRLDYDVDSPNPAYNGFWLKLLGANLKGYKKLVFYIKGDPLMGYSDKVKVELKSANEMASYLVSGINDEWQKIAIPLSEFKTISDWSSMQEFVIVFDDTTATKKTGSVNIDEVYFTK